MKLPDKPVLQDYQKLIRQLVIERGFNTETPNEVFTLLIEEVGELAKAMRKSGGLKTSKHSKSHELEEEFADVFWLLIDLSNRLNVDLEKAFREKEEINSKRNWTHN